MEVKLVVTVEVSQDIGKHVGVWVGEEGTKQLEDVARERVESVLENALLRVKDKVFHVNVSSVSLLKNEDPTCYFKCDACNLVDTAPTSDVKIVGHPMCSECSREMTETTAEEYTGNLMSGYESAHPRKTDKQNNE